MEFPPLASSFGWPGWVERDAGRGERAGQVVKAEEVPRWSLEVCAARRPVLCLSGGGLWFRQVTGRDVMWPLERSDLNLGLANKKEI